MTGIYVLNLYIMISHIDTVVHLCPVKKGKGVYTCISIKLFSVYYFKN